MKVNTAVVEGNIFYHANNGCVCWLSIYASNWVFNTYCATDEYIPIGSYHGLYNNNIIAESMVVTICYKINHKYSPNIFLLQTK